MSRALSSPGDEASESKSDHTDVDGEIDEDEAGWCDAESDEEITVFRCFYNDESFANVNAMLSHCKEQHNLDFIAIVGSLNLEFYQAIKLVNFIRSEVKNGNVNPDLSSIVNFENEKYLKPVLEDDALLFTLDEVLLPLQDQNRVPGNSPANVPTEDRFAQLEGELSQIRAQYKSYRQAVEEVVDARWNAAYETLDSGDGKSKYSMSTNLQSITENDYFKSYGYLDIHSLMLKDKVRTESYRDFIYGNKHLFKDKVVLDVGCGTGILSMFCVRAGAKHVYAVDNASILDKAREIIYENKLDNKISCLRGKIEEISLPVASVDIIVSEWMGYCLQFEAMLDSVIWARDRYLKSPGGLMVPSHCTLRLAPIVDPDCVSEDIDFWRDVYGFSMIPLLEDVYDNVAIRQVLPHNLIASSVEVFRVPIQTIKTEELDFTSWFDFTLENDVECLDGWALWFDTFFLTSSTIDLPTDAAAHDSNSLTSGSIAFTTGPMGPETHWKSGVMLIKPKASDRSALKKGQHLKGTIKVSKGKDDQRALDIGIDCKNSENVEITSQIWRLR